MAAAAVLELNAMMLAFDEVSPNLVGMLQRVFRRT